MRQRRICRGLPSQETSCLESCHDLCPCPCHDHGLFRGRGLFHGPCPCPYPCHGRGPCHGPCHGRGLFCLGRPLLWVGWVAEKIEGFVRGNKTNKKITNKTGKQPLSSTGGNLSAPVGGPPGGNPSMGMGPIGPIGPKGPKGPIGPIEKGKGRAPGRIPRRPMSYRRKKRNPQVHFSKSCQRGRKKRKEKGRGRVPVQTLQEENLFLILIFDLFEEKEEVRNPRREKKVESRQKKTHQKESWDP